MLGLILAPLGQEVPGQYPNEVALTFGSNSYLCPPDPSFNTRGEQGLYYDTHLGGLAGDAIPTDAELATVYGYTPVAGGWIAAKEAYYPSTWVPPNNWSAAGQYGPQPSLKGLRGASSGTPGWLVAVVIAGLGVAGWWGYREFKKPVRA